MSQKGDIPEQNADWFSKFFHFGSCR